MNNKYPKREVPTLEEIKMALNTYERIEADDNWIYRRASWGKGRIY